MTKEILEFAAILLGINEVMDLVEGSKQWWSALTKNFIHYEQGTL
jgi:hypothetical protein